MSTTASEYVQSAQEQTLETIRQSQQAIVEGIRTWAEALPKAADLPALQATEALPSSQQLLQSGFTFAEQLLKSQREFAEGILAATEPVFEKMSWKVPAA
jgi:hypothetical protein